MSDLTSRLDKLSPAHRQLLLSRLRQEGAADRGPSRPPLVRRERGETAPLSFAQQRLWFLSRMDPGSPVYNVPGTLRLRGALDLGALRRSLEEVVRRHEVLRTTFEIAAGEVVQRVAPPGGVPLAVLDLEGRGEGELWAAIDAEIRRPFDLARGPLLRALVARLGSEDHVLVLTLHHIVSDGWSIGVLLREMGALYSSTAAGLPDGLPELPVQYADFAIWQREWLQGETLDRLLSSWRDRLAGAPASLDLGMDRPRPAMPGFQGAQHPIRLEALTPRLKAFAHAEGASPFMVLLAAFAALLQRCSGEDNLVVGSPIANRNLPEIEGLIGFFVNSLALRVSLAGDPTFRELTRRAREVALAAYAGQDLPFEKLVDELRRDRDAGRNPLFQVVLQVRNEPREPLRLPGLELELLEVEARTAKFDMVVNLTDEEGLGGVWKYATELFDRSTIARRVGQFESLVAGAVAEPDARISGLGLLAEAERQAVLREWSGAGAVRSAAGSLVERFARQAALRPEAVAVTGEGGSLTYAGLDALSGRLAQRLRALGAGPGDLVAVLLDRTPALVAALLGVLKAGAAYVPLDPTYPPDRLRFVLDDAQPAAVVSQDSLAEKLPGLAAARLVRMEDLRETVEPLPLPAFPAAEDPAYLIYTSGSTGRPKGVLVTHGQAGRLFDATAPWFGFGADDVWTLFHSCAFDFSVWEIWGALLHGGRLVVVPWGVSRSPAEMHALLREEGVTVLNQTPSAFRQLLAAHAGDAGDAGAQEPLSTLRWVIFGGEALDPRLLAPWWERHGDSAGMVNMYGITETTVHVTFRRLRPQDASAGSIIGVPIPDLRVYVAGPGADPAPIGIAGEMWVGGAGVAMGYLGRPELTAERFVPDPWSGEPGARLYRSGDLGRWRPAGELEYLGRIDHQVKVRGFRIEPGEIEAALVESGEVREAAVLAVDDGAGQRRLVAFAVPMSPGSPPAVHGLRQRLGERLPDYMVPAGFVFLDALPLTSTGKLDRRALLALAEAPPDTGARRDRVAPRTPLERALAGIFREVLGVEEIGIDDDFFDLGGDSIRAALLANRLQEALGEIVHVVAVFDAPRLADLAVYLEEHYPEAVERAGSGGAARDARRSVRVDADALDRAQALVRPLPPPPPGDVEGLNPEAVFVLSPPRSGTTLLRVLLGGHPRLFAPPELELLSFRTLAERAAAFSGRDAFWLEGAIRAVMEIRGCDADEARWEIEAREREGWSTRRFYREMQREMQEALGDRRLVDKTPSYALDPAVLERAEREFAGARYLHLVRHPGGMIRSFEEARLDQIFFRYAHGFGRRELAELIWTLSHRNILAFLAGVPPERQHRVVFEELTRDPRRVLEGICSFLGLDLHPDMLDPYREGGRRMTDGLHAESRMLGDVKFHRHRAIDPGVADRWRADLDPDVLGEPTRELARAFGYGSEPAAAGEAPLSFAQERLWFLDQLEPGLPVYNLAFAVALQGRLDPAAFQRALAEVVRRHAVLRTTFAARLEAAVQVIHPELPVPMPWVDLSGLPETGRAREARRLAAEEGRRGFDLARGPLLRATLLRLAEREHWVLLTLHHIVADGWSLDVLMRETAAGYSAFAAGRQPALPALPVQYADFARWQRRWLSGGVLDAQLAYWRERLADDVPLDLATDRPRPPVQTFRGGQRQSRLPERLWQAVASLGREREATPFMVLLAAFQALLARYTGGSSVAVGTPIANRNRADLEGLIGFFVNLLVLRTDVSGDPPFRELLDRVRAAALGAYAHQDLPFEKLVEELRPRRDPGRNPLFQVAFQTRATTLDRPLLDEPRMVPVELETRISKFDLKLGLGDGRDDLGASLEYSTDLFDGTTAGRLLAQFKTLLEGAAADPGRPLSDLPLLGAGERFQLLGEWNDTAAPYPAEGAVHEVFAEQARLRPGAPAADYPGETLTYRELEERSSRLARHLAGLGVRRGDLVGLCLERSAAAVVSLLGILKAGAAYLPLDPAYPRERLGLMLEDSGAVVVVTREGLASRLPGGVRPALLDAHRAGIERQPPVAPPVECGGDDLAYVVYTSGSTGRPKGVAVPHRAVLRLVLGTDYVRLDASDRVAQVATLSFDAATFEIWGPLLHGGCVVGISREVSLSPEDLAAELRGRSVTALFLTTALFNQAARESPDAFRSLRHLLFGGEAATPDRVREVLAKGAPDRLLHVYGPTENTTFSSWMPVREVPPRASTVAIGRPIANSRLQVLDAALRPVPAGVPGELFTGGDGLAWGYWRRPALTAERFLPDPHAGRPGARMYRTGDRVRLLPDGCVEFLGRFDDQVKIRGFRVEPGEVEAELLGHPAVRAAAVLALEGATPEDRRLAAFVVPRPGEEPGDLRGYLHQRLPVHLVPPSVLLLDDLPLTPNGKIDRRALAALAEERAAPGGEVVLPRTPAEETVAAIWSELLQRAPIGIHDDFFELGGHSLLATQLVSRLRGIYGRDLPLRIVFEHPTLAALAEAVSRGGGLAEAAPPEAIERISRDGADLDDLLAELDALSDDEAEHLLSLDGPA